MSLVKHPKYWDYFQEKKWKENHQKIKKYFKDIGLRRVSIFTIAKELNISRETVKKHLLPLLKEGFIEARDKLYFQTSPTASGDKIAQEIRNMLEEHSGAMRFGNPNDNIITEYFIPYDRELFWYDYKMRDGILNNILCRLVEKGSINKVLKKLDTNKIFIGFSINKEKLLAWLKTKEGRDYLNSKK
jgi:biotin operon repressor